jgi:hypothetical protein
MSEENENGAATPTTDEAAQAAPTTDEAPATESCCDQAEECCDSEPCPDQEGSWFDRLSAEREDLKCRLTDLNKFRASALIKDLSSQDKQLLTAQSKAMQALLRILDERISLNS